MKRNTKELSLFKIATPIFFEILLFMLLGLADTLMLSRYGTSAQSQIAVDAVGLSTQLTRNLNVIFAFISAGTGVLIAQNIGAGNEHEVRRISVISMGVNFFIGIVFSIILVLYGENFLSLMGLTGERLIEGTSYIQIVGIFMFGQALMNTMMVIIRSHGDTHITLKITIGMNILNVIGDAVFIFGLFGAPILGVKGVALATTFSRLIAVIIMLIVLFKKYIRWSDLSFFGEKPLEEVKQLLAIGVPSALENLSFSVAQMVSTWIILNMLPPEAYTARIYAFQISWFVLLFGMSVGQANQIMVGQYSGAREFEKAHKVCMNNFVKSFIVCTFLSVIAFIFRRQLIEIYTVDESIIVLGMAALTVNAFLEPGRTINMVIINGLKGAGDVVFPVALGTIIMWLVSVGVGYLLAVPLGLGLVGVWIGMALDEWIRGFFMYFRWRSGIWRTKVIAKAAEESAA